MRKIVKWIILGVASLIFIVIIAGVYKFNYLANQDGYDVDGNKIEESHNSEVLLKWFNLNTSNAFYVKIPGTKIECEITELIASDSSSYAKGYYVVEDEKGEVIIDNLGIVALNQAIDNSIYLVIPFSTSNQGSGLFKYLGTFMIDYQDKTIIHIDSYFLGDRIKINSIKYDGIENLQIELNIHSKNQAMSEILSDLKVVELNVVDGNFLGLY